jgi:hypothetical protein
VSPAARAGVPAEILMRLPAAEGRARQLIGPSEYLFYSPSQTTRNPTYPFVTQGSHWTLVCLQAWPVKRQSA